MDADSSYGGSDTAQDSTFSAFGSDMMHNTSSTESTTAMPTTEPSSGHNHHGHHQDSADHAGTNNTFYHKNEITLPVNYDETDFQGKDPADSTVHGPEGSPKMGNYLSTAKLNINETLENHSNLEELNKQYNSTHRLHPDTPKSRKKSSASAPGAGGVDNPGFATDDEDMSSAKRSAPVTPNAGHHRANGNGLANGAGNGSTAGGYTNGDLNLTSPAKAGAKNQHSKDQEHMTEAVNLELVNLKPMTTKDMHENGTNGTGSIPVKKDADVEMGNPYDEYFVPVNEHRKYMSHIRSKNSVTFAETITAAAASGGVHKDGLSVTSPQQGILDYPNWLNVTRGEKLYVTMDKRNKKGCGKCLCWSLCLGIVAAAVIIAILAASGVIFSKEAQPVGDGGVTSRQFGSGTVQEEENPVKAAGGILGLGTGKKSSTTPLTPGPPLTTMPSMPQTTEMSMISVPRAIESRLLIDNAQFYPELAHTNSSEFKELATILEREIMNALFTEEIQKYGAANIEVKVMEFMPGSIVVKYRVAWTFKEGIHNPVDPVDKDSLKKKMDKVLANNSGYLNKYHVPYDTVISERIIDLCQIENNGCQFDCTFDYQTADFMCHCPEGMELMIDAKTCQMKQEHEPSAEPEPTSEPQPEPSAEPEPAAEPNAFPELEPNVEPEPTVEHAEPKSTPEPEPTAEPESITEPNAEPEPSAEPESKDHAAIVEHITTEEPKSEPEPTAEPKSEPEPTAEPKSEPEPTAEPKSEPEPTAEPKSEPEPTAEPKSEPEPTAEPNAEPEPTAEPKSEPEPTAEPKSEPEPTAEPKSEPEPTAEPKSEPEPTAEPNAEPEPTAEPKSEPEPTAEHKTEPEATAEPAAEPETTAEPKSEPEPTAEPKSEPEPTAEPKSEPEPTAEPKSAPEPTAELNAEPEPNAEPKSEPEPTAEPKSEPEPTAEPKSEPEPTSEPEPEPKSDSEASTEHSHHVLGADKTEPERTPEPSAEPNSTEHTKEPEATPEPEPAAEPTAEPETKSEGVIKAHNVETGNHVVSEESSTEPNPFDSHDIIEPEFVITHAPDLDDQENEPKKDVIQEGRGHKNDEEVTAIPMEKSSESPTTESIVESASKEPFGVVKHIYDVAETTISSSEMSSTSTTESGENKIVKETTKENKETSSSEEENFLHVIPLRKSTTTTATPEMDTDSPMHKIVIQEVSGTEKTVEVTENSKEHWIPVTLNDVHEHLYTSNDLSDTKNKTDTTAAPEVIPVVINNMPETIEAENHAFENVSTSEKPLEMSGSTESMPEVNKTTEHNTEHFNVLENMSPFLPEIENDTLIQILRSDGDHFTEQPHLEHIEAEHTLNDLKKAPRLDDDQMNVTNPKDDNMTPAVVTIRNNSTDSIREALTTPNPFINRVEPIKIIDGSQATTDEAPATTIVPETSSEKGSTESGSNENKFIDLSSSTEMLIAMETTTKNQNQIVTDKIAEAATENQIPVESTEMPGNTEKEDMTVQPVAESVVKVEETTEAVEEKDATTVHAEIVHTVTETVQTVHEVATEAVEKSIEKVSEENPSAEEVKTTEAPSSEVNDVHMSSENAETTTKSEEKLTSTTAKQYEVREVVTDTEIPDLAVEKDNEDAYLSVIPLPGKKKHLSKLEHKRVAENEFTNLDKQNILNDITNEEESGLDDKFNNLNSFDNDIGSRSDVIVASGTTSESNPDIFTSNEFADKTTQKIFLDKAAAGNNKKKSYFDKKYSKTQEVLGDKPSGFEEVEEMPKTSQVEEKLEMPEAKEVIDGSVLGLGLGFSKCTVGQFQCLNGTSVKAGSYCIPKSDRCDSLEDCTDASDEVGCAEEKCPNNFQCSSGQCLKRHHVCDGIINCNDGTDEQGCDAWECNFDEFRCAPGGRCIPLAWKCDGLSQCPDSTDEQQCPKDTCADDEYHCADQNTCIPASWRCNGRSDCSGNEDEKLCDCPQDQFRCLTGGGCVSQQERCNGVAVCPDRSDEWDCVKLATNDGDTKSAPPGGSNLFVEILSSEGKWHQICAEQWNNTYSDLVCQQLGYAGATMTENVSPNQSPFLKLKSTVQRRDPLLSMFEVLESCSSSVAITCQDFTCGSQSSVDTQSPRIIGGSGAGESQWPSITLLYNKKRNAQCTGSLVAPKWVLASYSCVLPSQTDGSASEWSLYAGGAKYFTNSDNSTTQIRTVKSIVKQPQTKYDQFLYSYDAVLMELSSPLNLNRNVSVVCLPDSSVEMRQFCVTAGWGVSKPGESNVQQYLNYIPVPVTDRDECNSSRHYNGHIGEDKICAGYTESEKSVCYNDEGAPLMCLNEASSTWELQGVLSYHGNCGKSKHPPIYTSLNTIMKQWISKTVGERAILSKGSTYNAK